MMMLRLILKISLSSQEDQEKGAPNPKEIKKNDSVFLDPDRIGWVNMGTGDSESNKV